MNTESETSTGLPTCTLSHPDNVLADPMLSQADKKALLASWASDVRAVRDAPGYRQLDSGAIIEVDEILQALNALDAVPQPHRQHAERVLSYQRHDTRLTGWRRRFRSRKGPDDDNNQPPPCTSAVYPLAGRDVVAAN